MSEAYRDGEVRISLEDRLIGIIQHPESEEELKYATELYGQMFEKHTDDNLVTDNVNEPGFESIDFRVSNSNYISQKMGSRAIDAIKSDNEYLLGERLVNRNGLVYCERLGLGFRFDNNVYQEDTDKAHLHMFGNSGEELGVIIMATDIKHEYEELQHRVFLESLDDSFGSADAVTFEFGDNELEKRQLIRNVAISYIGSLDNSQRRPRDSNLKSISI